MTHDSPALLTPEADSRSRSADRRRNKWERALWIVGVLLLVISAGLVYGFFRLVFAEYGDQTSAQTSTVVAFVQASSIYSPAFVTGGIVCIALALFSRALDVNASRRDDSRPILLAADPAAAEVVATPIAVVPPATPIATVSTDYAAFMRPDAATDSNK